MPKALSIAERIASAEAAQLEELAVIEAEAATLTEAIARHEQQLYDTQAHAEALRDAQSPTDTLTFEELLKAGEQIKAADAAVEVVESILSGARANVAALHRSASKVSDKNVAEAVLPVVAQTLPGVEAHATFLPMKEICLSDLPLAVLVQTSKSEDAEAPRLTGSVSARVELHYYATPIHREVRSGEIQDAARKLGINLTAHRLAVVPLSLEGGESTVHRFVLNVTGVVPQVPTLRFRERALSDLALTLAHELKTTQRGNRVIAERSAQVADTRTQEDGSTLATIDVAITLSERESTYAGSGASFGTPHRPDPYGAGGASVDAWEAAAGFSFKPQPRPLVPVDTAMANLDGCFVANVGRVVSAGLVSQSVSNGGATFCVRTVVTYRAA